MPHVVTRFAPSPTGYLHVGGARTALFNWLLARHTGGTYLLRIEDTDLARSTQSAVDQLVEDLKWLGLNWDNVQLVYQSKRLDIYNKIIDDLLARNLAYPAYETNEELNAQRAIAERGRRQYRYRRPVYSADQLKKFADEGRTPVVRFAMEVKEYRFEDAVLGANQGVGPGEVQDFVIRKSDGMPTYHFGVVVDDAEMNVTHVLRGQEQLLNTVNHVALQDALGYPRPTYAHLPVILNPETGEKLSKRDRDRKIRKRVGEIMRSTKRTPVEMAAAAAMTEDRFDHWYADEKKQLDLAEQERVMKVAGLRESDLPEIMVHDFRKNGYLPEVLNNFLALLGWSPGGDRERMSMEQLVELFDLGGVGKSNAKFNREKLAAFNTEACAAAPADRLLTGLRDFLGANPASPLNGATDEQLREVLAMNVGFRLFRDVDDKSAFFFVPDEQIAYAKDAVEKVLLKNDSAGRKALEAVAGVLGGVGEWKAGPIEAAVKGYCESSGQGLGKVAQPLRVAVSGTAVSPPIFESLELLGKERVLARIARCLAVTKVPY